MKKLLRLFWLIAKVVLFAIGCVTVLGVLVCVAIALVVACLSPDVHKIEDKSVLVFNLDTQIRDRPTDETAEMFEHLFGNDESILQLRSATTALREAAHDKRISGLYLHGNLQAEGYSSGYGALKELREAIQDFQKSGKPVMAYIGDADNRDYYLESAADQILLNPLGMLAFRGLATEGFFLKGAADKYGFEFTAVRHGKYKGAVEPFTREDYSAENREQLEALLKDMWGDILNTVATSRKIAPDQLQALVDQNGLINAQIAKDRGLVTALAYEGQAIDQVRQWTGKTTNDTTFPQVSMADYAHEAEQTLDREHARDKDKIAVVYAEGEIVDGAQETSGQVAGSRYARIVRKLRERKDVKAIVLRVNSPGGSGQASDVILDELRRFNHERPVVVSMGTVAASGGYFISMASRRILAEPGTITGSIGVFGLTLNAKKLANDHGITFDTIKTGDLADLGTITRPMTDKEQTVLQNLVGHFYNDFIERVARDRKMTTNQVDDIAQGRVWSGADALKNGLVDELGGLQQAIGVAAKDAKLGTNYSVIEFPEPKPLGQQIAEAIQGKNEQPLVKNEFAARVKQIVIEEWHWLSSFNDPHGIYTRLPFDVKLN